MKTITNNNKYFIYFRKQLHKFVVVLVIISVFFNVLNINQTSAYFTDTETINGNTLTTAMLDFILTNNTLEKIIGPEALGEVSHASVAMPEDGSLPMQYDVSTTIDTLSSDSAFCSGLIVEAKLNGISKYIGPLPNLANAVTTEFGSWEFRFDLPPTVSIPNNVKCSAQVLFFGWREDIINKEDSSWYDEEILDISLTSRMVVLNEIYARPNSEIAPKDREYIELYNNSNTPVDVLGWQISEMSGTTEKFYHIVASGAVSGKVQPYDGVSTIIPSGGFLVLEFGGTASRLNDGGDTVKLYDDSISLLDSHTYSSIPAGKSVVRFPDGIGFWVDPEPTPGTTNMVSMEDLRDAGFDDEMIEEVLKLMAITNTTLLSDTEEIIEPIESIEPEDALSSSVATEEVIEPADALSSGVAMEESAEEIVEAEEDVVEEIITEIPPVTEPEEIVTEESEVVETTIGEVVEPVSVENPEVVIEEVVESVELEESPLSATLPEEIPQASPEEVVEVVESAPAVEPAVVIE